MEAVYRKNWVKCNVQDRFGNKNDLENISDMRIWFTEVVQIKFKDFVEIN